MAIVYEELMALKNLGQKYSYGDREVMLYAYGIGMGADPMDEKELAFVNEGTLTPRAAEGGADLCVRRGLGLGSRRHEDQPPDGGRRRARHHLPQAAADGGQHHRRLHRARRLRQGQGQGRRDPPPDRAEGREGREARHAGRLALRPRRRRLWRPVGRPARAAQDPEPRARQDRRHLDAAGPGAGLPPLRRPQSAALRSGIRPEGRLPAADPARHVHLRHHLPRRAADLMPITIRPPSASTSRGSPRRSIPARPSPWTCGRTAT